MPDRRLAHVALVIDDYDTAIDYFTRVLDFELIADTPLGGGKRWVLVGAKGRGGSALLLAEASDAEQKARIGDQTGGRVFLFLDTDDFDRDFASFTQKGVEFLEAPRHEPYGTVAVFRDRWGNKWDLIQLKR